MCAFVVCCVLIQFVRCCLVFGVCGLLCDVCCLLFFFVFLFVCCVLVVAFCLCVNAGFGVYCSLFVAVVCCFVCCVFVWVLLMVLFVAC